MKIVNDVVNFVANVTHLQADKVKHGLVGAVVAGAALLGTGNKEHAKVMVGVLALGVAKEVYDAVANELAGKDVHDVDLFDILATVIGGAIVVGISLLSI